MMWRGSAEIVTANVTLAETPSSWWDYHRDMYAITQAVGVRRQADVDRDVASLAKIISEMQHHGHHYTLDDFLGQWHTNDPYLVQKATETFRGFSVDGQRFSPDVAKADYLQLREDAKRITDYVNEHVAHGAHTPRSELPTMTDLHDAIDRLNETFLRYYGILTVRSLRQLEPVIQDDWKAIFRVPWIES